jgi:hypothetical protein
LPKAILRIHATRPSCVYVETGRPVIRGLEKSFVACKQDGKWRIREKSVEEWRTIVTE